MPGPVPAQTDRPPTSASRASDHLRRVLNNGGRRIPLVPPAMRLVRPADRVLVLGPGDGSVAAILAGRRGVPNLCAVVPDTDKRAALQRAFLEHGLFRTRLEPDVPKGWTTTCLIADLTLVAPDDTTLLRSRPSRAALIRMPPADGDGSAVVCRLMDDGMDPLPGAWADDILVLVRRCPPAPSQGAQRRHGLGYGSARPVLLTTNGPNRVGPGPSCLECPAKQRCRSQ
jgi:hypothetical protein